MKSSQIAAKYKIDKNEFESFVRERGLRHADGFASIIIYDCDVMRYVTLFMDSKKRNRDRENTIEKEKAEREAEKRKALSQMLISSGFNFEGYKIVRYSGYISGDDATQIPRSGIFGGNNNGSNLTDALVKIRRQALKELKEAAYNLGCNAVIGVDFDYITLEPETANITGGTLYEPYIISVTANGNAVIIEKIDELENEE